MISIDANILLYSLNPDSIWHGAAVAFLRQNLGIPSVRIAITDYVLVELYVLLRNPVVMAKALTANAARDLVTAYWDAPNVSRIENANVMDEVWKLAGGTDFARRRIFDARLALTLSPSFARILKKVRKFGISAIGCSVTCLLLTVVISKFHL